MTCRIARSRTALLFFFAPALICSLFASPAAAQAVYGSVRGTITDASGAVLPGVSVTITSKERNTSDTVVTDAEGVYRKERLLPGVYEIRTDLEGFKQAVVSNVVVGVDAQSNADFSLAMESPRSAPRRSIRPSV